MDVLAQAPMASKDQNTRSPLDTQVKKIDASGDDHFLFGLKSGFHFLNPILHSLIYTYHSVQAVYHRSNLWNAMGDFLQ